MIKNHFTFRDNQKQNQGVSGISNYRRETPRNRTDQDQSSYNKSDYNKSKETE